MTLELIAMGLWRDEEGNLFAHSAFHGPDSDIVLAVDIPLDQDLIDRVAAPILEEFNENPLEVARLISFDIYEGAFKCFRLYVVSRLGQGYSVCPISMGAVDDPDFDHVPLVLELNYRQAIRSMQEQEAKAARHLAKLEMDRKAKAEAEEPLQFAH